jgi:hypothetical protein
MGSKIGDGFGDDDRPRPGPGAARNETRWQHVAARLAESDGCDDGGAKQRQRAG